ncbi:hypothetical protein BSK62_25255 [Paenibacillus odorifer]|uniref:P-loop NTPase fold protein n=1 Tax=Paenibacillus odorifer TaxID=189426 RepID=UPI00096F2F3A|nr:P-loop NTPase fold protein [Paenibacillus odorifer]OMD60670.1 hypothetical protein BSK62_25255 [Paenibacillus odorifer]
MFNRSREDQTRPKKLFLEDRPLKNSSGDKFQYTQVAEVICDVLEQNNFPVHIGLFGPWGSGKTSVIKLLENKIHSDSKTRDKYLIKTLSVWKFADDSPSLHRKIVRQVQSELGVDNEEGLSVELTNTETATGSGLFSLLVKSKLFKISALIYVLLLVLSILLNIVADIPKINGILTAIMSPAAVALMLSGFGKLLSGNFQISNLMTRKNMALLHNDQYEARFETCVNQYLQKNNGKKLILVFDDLDRLPPEQLLAALNTIKTFLHSNNCAFILPCDETVLRNGIKAAFEKKDILPDEDTKKSENNYNYVSDFISKTFDYIIHLPIVEQRNMKTFARELIGEQRLSWMNDPEINLNKIMGVLIHSETKTPRQVKTLINSFVANWELAKKRDNESGIQLLTKEPQAIALFTVLQTDYPDYYASLIKEPYSIYRSDSIVKQDTLKAYLTRIEKFIPKDDPRPFIYFSNEKLNPATGKPELLKVMNYLINGQVNEFNDSFVELSIGNKQILLSSVISDLNDNPGIEVENCLKSLIESEVDLTDVVSDMELHNWDLFLRENIDVLLEYKPSKVCKVLNNLSFDTKTWSDYGTKLNLEDNIEDLIGFWMSQPSDVEKLKIPNLGRQVREIKTNDNDGYSLIQQIFALNEGHAMLNEIDWIHVIAESLSLNYSPDYTLESVIREINNKTNDKVTADLLNHFLDLYDFKEDEFIDGIGKLWITIYSGSIEEIKGFISLFKHVSFSGFDDEDLIEVNSIMKNAPYRELKTVVDNYLEEEEDKGNINRFIETFPDSPGIPGFCATNFNFDLSNETRSLYLSVIINRYQHIDNIDVLIPVIKKELDIKASQQVKSKVPEVVGKLIQKNDYKRILISMRKELLPLENIYMWFHWTEEVFVERLDMFFLLYKDDEDATNWIMNCVNTMVLLAVGYTSIGYTYAGNASRYLNILVSNMVSIYIDIDWEETIDKWKIINGSYNLFNSLDSITRPQIIGQLSNRCELSSSTYNQLLREYMDLTISNHRAAVFNRWEVIGEAFRSEVIQKLLECSEDIAEECNKLLVKHLTTNSQVIFLNEFIEWDIKESFKELYLRSLIKNLSSDDCENWVLEEMIFMNQEGFNKWKGLSVEYAAELGKINLNSLKPALETALDLGQARAKLALKVLTKVTLSKAESKRFREKIVKHYNEYPDLVNHFGYRFTI